jgi:hypothetical protein
VRSSALIIRSASLPTAAACLSCLRHETFRPLGRPPIPLCPGLNVVRVRGISKPLGRRRPLSGAFGPSFRSALSQFWQAHGAAFCCACIRGCQRFVRTSTLWPQRLNDGYHCRFQVCGLKVAGPRNHYDEGLADVAAANPFRLPRNHPGIGSSSLIFARAASCSPAPSDSCEATARLRAFIYPSRDATRRPAGGDPLA